MHLHDMYSSLGVHSTAPSALRGAGRKNNGNTLQIELELEERGKLVDKEKCLLEQGREPTKKNSTHIGPRVWKSNQATLVGGKYSHQQQHFIYPYFSYKYLHYNKITS